MDGDGGAGGPATGDGTGQGASGADGGPGGAPQTGPASGAPTQPAGPSAWDAVAARYGDPDRVLRALEHARTWEERAKANKGAADQVPTLQQQVDQLTQQMADQAGRDAERAGKTATALLKAELAKQHIDPDDVAELLPDPKRLLKDGEPDDKAITKFAGVLAKVAGRPAPDPDQGRKGGDPPADMNGWIRRQAGVRQN